MVDRGAHGLAAAEADDDLRAQAVTQLSLADAYLRQSRYQHAVDHFTRALTLSGETGWLEGQATVLCNLGLVYWQSGRLPEAVDHLSKALVIARQTGQIASQAVVLGNLGVVYSESGRLRAAADHLTRALALNRKLGSATASPSRSPTSARPTRSRAARPRRRTRQTLSLHREIGNRSAEADTLRILAAVHREPATTPGPSTSPAPPCLLARDIGDRRVEADALNALASVQLHRARAAPRKPETHGQAVELARSGPRACYPEVVTLVGLVYTH